MPYVDSFRYYDGDYRLSTKSRSDFDMALDSTDGEIGRNVIYCARCGERFVGSEEDLPDDIHWSEYNDGYYCDDCCWWCEYLEDYISNDEVSTYVFTYEHNSDDLPMSYVRDLIVYHPDGNERYNQIVSINDEYYMVDNPIVHWDEKNKCYVIQPNSD